MLSAYEIIAKKKTGAALSEDEISFFVEGYTAGRVPDYQAAALLMAICLRGMNDTEAAALTGAMMRSGDVMDLSDFGNHTADKHSTGGIGDKTTLIVAPIAACLGCVIPKMSGRGLGHTGGTVDKLEAIHGYRTVLSPEEFEKTVKKTGIAVIGQSGNLAPADKKLYALRDVTATVDSIPLIASSIMSKKLAAGAKSIVLDVKVGSGAFMKTAEEARRLARLMVDIGTAHGRRVLAVLSNMDMPLGAAVGNAVEVAEAVDVLRGRTGGALRTLSVTLAALLAEAACGIPRKEALKRAEEAIESGAAFKKMCEWIAAQGGNISVLENTALLPQARYTKTLTSDTDGYITAINAEEIGLTAVTIGAGRTVKEDTIDPSAGIIFKKNVGDRVKKGEAIATLLTTEKPEILATATKRLGAAVTIKNELPRKSEIIFDIID